MGCQLRQTLVHGVGDLDVQTVVIDECALVGHAVAPLSPIDVDGLIAPFAKRGKTWARGGSRAPDDSTTRRAQPPRRVRGELALNSLPIRRIG